MRTQRTEVSAGSGTGISAGIGTGISVLALLTLAACGTESGSGPGSGGGSDTARSDVPVTGVAWQVDSLTVGGKKTEAPEGSRLEIGPKGRATAYFGCNHIGARAEVEGDRITLSEPSRTEMACGAGVDAFEEAAVSALDGELTAKLSGEKLTLTAEGGDTMALTEERPADLAGTRWAVNTLIDGETATSVPADLPKERVPHLTFGEDGTVQGNYGCNSYRGKATVKGATITFGPRPAPRSSARMWRWRRSARSSRPWTARRRTRSRAPRSPSRRTTAGASPPRPSRRSPRAPRSRAEPGPPV